ncbi:multiprotein bridging factor aMBF1 [Halohasta litorea]|uniref:Multiprotein bridging factor aMBF1 n=1 Tax=Halohasta litorea TaxID=869891 RepID=A0ABD6D8Q2_9EURY|nr:multiprotein bridging factor aMBF1 [Halohasta litorea]
MPQCEMCGADETSLTTTKVEGAELELCENCQGFGTTVETQESSSSTSKYSTSSSSGTSGSSGGATGGSTGSGGSTRRKKDMFDDMDELAADYDDRIREARESEGLTQEELADDLNEKASLIRKLERGDILPSDEVQTKLEKKLEISLIEGTDVDDTEWSSGSGQSMTLGDVVERKD